MDKACVQFACASVFPESSDFYTNTVKRNLKCRLEWDLIFKVTIMDKTCVQFACASASPESSHCDTNTVIRN